VWNHGTAPSQRCDRGAFYLVCKVGGMTRKLLVHDQIPRPWNPIRAKSPRLPIWSVSPCQGCTHLMGRSSPDTRGGRGTGLRTRGVGG